MEKLDAFELCVKAGLELYAQPDQLGAQSPLAQPFFLGNATTEHDVRSRGQALINCIKAALQATQNHEAQKILEAYALKREFVFSKRTPDRAQPRFSNPEIARQLNMSERTLYRERDAAIKLLARQLLLQARPVLANEGVRTAHYIARSAPARLIADALSRKQSVALMGNSGCGKTALARHCLAGWAGPVFSYTLRPGVNGHISALVFSLSLFLRDLGAMNLWRQWLADGDAQKLEVILPILRYDLKQLESRNIAILFDEIDLLDTQRNAHFTLAHCIEEVAAIVPVLLVGQRVALPSTHRIELGGFQPDEYEAWLATSDLSGLNPITKAKLFAVTEGNPGLLELMHSLHVSGGDLAQVLAQPEAVPTADVIFDRACRRLDAKENKLLSLLALAHSPLPATVFEVDSNIVTSLENRRLIAWTQEGVLQISPFIKKLAQRQAEQTGDPDAHIFLAQKFNTFGMTISAMHHLIKAGHADQAIWLWHKREQIEINRGMAQPAYEMLCRLDENNLSDRTDRLLLSTLRGSLARTLSRFDEAVEFLAQVPDTAPVQLASEAFLKRGIALQHRGHEDASLEAMRKALALVDLHTEAQRVRIRHNLAHAHLQLKTDRTAAENEALLALHEALILNGETATYCGRFVQAHEFLRQAIELSQDKPGLTHERAVALSARGNLLWRQGNLKQAIDDLQQAIHLHQQRSNLYAEANDRNTLCAALIVSGENDAAIAEGHKALAVADALNHSLLICGITANLAEAYLNLQLVAESRKYIMRALATEEQHYLAFALTLLGMIHAREHRLEDAAQALTSAINIATEQQRPYEEAIALRELGKLHVLRGDPRAATESLSKARAILAEMNLPDEVKKIDAALQAQGS